MIWLVISLPVVSFLTLAIGYGLGLQRGYREGRGNGIDYDRERAEKRGKLRSV